LPCPARGGGLSESADRAIPSLARIVLGEVHQHAKPPAGAGWLHQIKHDGFRMLVRRDGAGVRLSVGSADRVSAPTRRCEATGWGLPQRGLAGRVVTN
jgi:hypothetical protein